MKTKTCTRCNETKELTKFRFSFGDRISVCNACMSEQRAATMAQNGTSYANKRGSGPTPEEIEAARALIPRKTGGPYLVASNDVVCRIERFNGHVWAPAMDAATVPETRVGEME